MEFSHPWFSELKHLVATASYRADTVAISNLVSCYGAKLGPWLKTKHSKFKSVESGWSWDFYTAFEGPQVRVWQFCQPSNMSAH